MRPEKSTDDIDLAQVVELVGSALQVTDEVHITLANHKTVTAEMGIEDFDRLAKQAERTTCRIGRHEVSFADLALFFSCLSRLEVFKRPDGWPGALEELSKRAAPMTDTPVCLTTDTKLR